VSTRVENPMTVYPLETLRYREAAKAASFLTNVTPEGSQRKKLSQPKPQQKPKLASQRNLAVVEARKQKSTANVTLR